MPLDYPQNAYILGASTTERPMFYIYASYKSAEKANAALEDMFANGEVFACELYGTWISKINGRYCITLKA